MLHTLSMSWTTIAVAPPPPLQIAATPYSPGLRTYSSVVKILDPDEPNACPRAIAPPLTLTLAGSRPRICSLLAPSLALLIIFYDIPQKGTVPGLTFSFALLTAAKASLISHLAMSLTLNPACCSALGIANVGANGKSIGLVAASA